MGNWPSARPTSARLAGCAGRPARSRGARCSRASCAPAGLNAQGSVAALGGRERGSAVIPATTRGGECLARMLYWDERPWCQRDPPRSAVRDSEPFANRWSGWD